MNLLVAKQLLFKVVPYRVVRFFIKYCSINYFLFGPARKKVGQYLLNSERQSFVFDSADHLSLEVFRGFLKCCDDYLKRKSLLREYVLKCEDSTIEPKYGWAVLNSSRTLVFDSIANNAWKETYHPSYRNYRSRRTWHFPEVVSIRMINGGERNYWHFYHDILGQVYLAHKYALNHLPLIVSKSLAGQKFFQEAVNRSSQLSKLSWIVQDEEYISADVAYFIQNELNSIEQFLWARDILDVPVVGIDRGRRIFLTRGAKRIRCISNCIEIESVARDTGFEIVDTDGMSLDEQITLFSSSSHVAGIHGAGLTNIIFRRGAPLRILEIFPADYIQPHYYWLSKKLGHSYSCTLGKRMRSDLSFAVDPKKFASDLNGLSGSRG